MAIASATSDPTRINNAIHAIVSGSETRDDDAAIDSMLESVQAYFDLPLAIIAKVEGDTYTVDRVIDRSGQVAPGMAFDLSETYCIEVLEREHAIFVAHYGATARASHPCYVNMGLETYVGARLVIDGAVYGTLNLSSPDIHPREFDAGDLSVLETAASLISSRLGSRERRLELDQRLAQLELAAASAGVGYWEVDFKTGRVTWSKEVYGIHGVDPETYEPDLESGIDFYHPDDRDAVREFMDRVVKTRRPGHFELRLIRAGGEERLVTSHALCRVGPKDEVTGVFGVFQDVTDIRAAEQRIRDQAEALQRSNEDLEQFAFTASHDLREPLRKMVTFSQILQHEHGDKLDEEGQSLLSVIIDGGRRMRQLIDSLLAFSRVQTGPLQVTRTPVETLVSRACDMLSEAIEEAGAEIECQATGALDADPDLMTEVFQNLIGNAVKYGGESAPRIEITARETEEDGRPVCEISISDNGIGFEPAHAQRIFEPFRRLHARSAYAGAGIGLAFCERVIERHGGRIRAESEPGKGARFLFTIPKASSQDTVVAPA